MEGWFLFRRAGSVRIWHEDNDHGRRDHEMARFRAVCDACGMMWEDWRGERGKVEIHGLGGC